MPYEGWSTLPGQVACPDCAAQPNELCRAIDVSGFAYAPLSDFHASRIEAAAFISGVGNDKPVSVEAFNKAVEDSDLI